MFDQLRHTTRQSQACLEKTFISKLRALRTAEDYAQLLGTLHDFYSPVEALVMSHVDSNFLPDVQERRKVKALVSDLADLNITHVVRCPPHLPRIINMSTAIGALYVTEGSTLGGQIIAGMLNKQLRLENGLSFFKFYGQETDNRWDYFRNCLALHQQKFNVTEICDSACQTFESMNHWLEKN